MILKTAANMQEHGYIETGKEGGYYEVGGQRTEIGGGGSTMLKCTYTGEQLDKNFGEIYDAFMAGAAVMLESNTADNGSGTWALLQSVELNINDEYCEGMMQFASDRMTTGSCANLEEARASYPQFAD
jgi:hypothetical protein